ncbi:MAG: iron-sulfur cluster repair di-iron protein [Bacteroidetes bacterium B1(2017)]|nr:MAG: iron-sulfur cluster repair di-iron protein [Bacteroidetes bacterium B1(2017)]
MNTNTDKTIGSFVATDYRTASVFQKYGIDFCCKGGKTLAEVCQTKQLDSKELLNELTSITQAGNSLATNFTNWPLDLLVNYIQKIHHTYVVNNTEPLIQFLNKLCKVHGSNHPELFEINEQFMAAAGELAAHMKKEELILFPYVQKLQAAKESNRSLEQAGFGSVQNPIQVMMNEHEVEGDRFRKISELSSNYTPPADGCTTYRVAYAMLKEFEQDLHLHIHLENNILFPKAIELEKSLQHEAVS